MFRRGVESFPKFDTRASFLKTALSEADPTSFHPIDALRPFLNSCGPGPVKITDSFVRFPAEAWDSFSGSG